MKKQYIIAENYRQYTDYINHKLNKWEYIYVYDKIVLFGTHFSIVYLMGTYQLRPDWYKLKEILKINESIIIYE
jgi:hypothetical protein